MTAAVSPEDKDGGAAAPMTDDWYAYAAKVRADVRAADRAATLHARVVRAAIEWHVNNTPLEGPHDRSARADQLRAEMRQRATEKLHAAVEAATAGWADPTDD